jgi:bla regulator protein BlaR1
VLGPWMIRRLRVRSLIHSALPVQETREAAILPGLQRLHPAARSLPILHTNELMEPGIVGILRPALLWPVGFSEHLNDAELQSILAHELCHVRRQDNLAAALHMLIEALFWFHPMLWWIGARLMEERERACDEEVLRLGNSPHAYAEGILKACRFCVSSPLACISGVTSSHRSPARSKSILQRRILHIMSMQSTQTLSSPRKALLALTAVTAIALPIVFGFLHAPQLQAQAEENSPTHPASFDSISIKPSHSAGEFRHTQLTPHGISYDNVSVKELIERAYGILGYQISGAPDWLSTDRYDVQANSSQLLRPVAMQDGKPAKLPSPGLQTQMLRTLLADRFNLRLQEQSRVLPVYDLTIASSGIRFAKTAAPPVAPNGEQIISVRTATRKDEDELLVSGPVDAFADQLSERLGTHIADKTGLEGSYDLNLRWTPESTPAEEISAAVEKQLGLKLQPQQAPLKAFTVMQVDKPAED